MSDFVESDYQVKQNIQRFNSDLGQGKEQIVKRLSQFRHWCCVPDLDLFGPCKFIGYKDLELGKDEV